MNTKVWYLPYSEGVYHTRMIETYFNVNARMVHTMLQSILNINTHFQLLCFQDKHNTFLEYFGVICHVLSLMVIQIYIYPCISTYRHCHMIDS